MADRKKYCDMSLRLSAEEMEDLTAKAEKAGVSRNAYIRKVMKESKVQEAPIVDFGDLIQVLTRTYGELNWFQSQGRQQDDGQEEKIRETLREIQNAVQEILRIYGEAG